MASERTVFRRLAIVNRGEPAMRLLNAVAEYNRERDADLRTIALYTEPDRSSMFVREAHESYYLGGATFVDPRDGSTKNRYLDYQGLERALIATRAEAVWVGWGFVAEHAEFVDLCDRLGVVFIGPSGDVMRQLGDKIQSKRIAERAEVPVAAWSGGPVASLEEAREHAERLGFPLMIKATAGGGGRGIRKVRDAGELEEALKAARSEALKGFGDDTVFIERMLTGARHVEVQIIGDGQGTTWALGVRDCTIQRRNQKVVEEAPSPVLSEAQDRMLRQASVRLADAVGYRNAGTVEFLYQPQSQTFSFMEVNARLQVEHPVTEVTTGVDLVKLQLHVAQGGTLEGEPPQQRGHAIEVRLNAEDADNGFAPAPGTVERFRIPTGPGVRVDTGVDEGDRIAPEFDSMIAKVIAHGRDRAEAIARLSRALAGATVIVRGGMSNKGFLLGLLGRQELHRNEVDVGWLDRLLVEGEHVSRQGAEVALIQAACEAYELELGVEKARFYAAAARGRPATGDEVGRAVELSYHGQDYELLVDRLSIDSYRVRVDGVQVDVRVERLNATDRRLHFGRHRRHRVLSVVDGSAHIVEVDGVSHRVSRDRGGIVRAPAPAVVVSVAVKEGDQVAVGDRLAVLEAMKTETPIVAKMQGTVRKVLVVNNVQVGAEDPLIVIEPPSESSVATESTRARFVSLTSSGAEVPGEPESRLRRNAAELKSLMLGYDVGASERGRILEERSAICRELSADDEQLLASEIELLSIFADVCSIFHRIPGAEESDRRSSEEYLFTYLRDLGRKGEGLPQSFIGKLEAVLAHYGVERLDRTAELEEPLFRLFKAHRRIEQQLEPIASILERCQNAGGTVGGAQHHDFRRLLGRLINETQGRFVGVSALAREVRYRVFELPVLEQARARAYAEVSHSLDALVDASGAERAALAQNLVDCPHPLQKFFLSRYREVDRHTRELMLEVMVRRYYRVRELENVTSHDLQHGIELLTTDYRHEGRQIHLFALQAEHARIAEAVETLRPMLEQVPEDHDPVIDLYVWRSQPLGDVEAAQQALARTFGDAGLRRSVRRIVVATTGLAAGNRVESVEHFTFRPTADGYREERLYRGFHPMMGKRLQLWRLSEFECERLTSAEDIYVFRAIGRDNPKDERLFALAEVRDLTPVRDDEGRVIALPELERKMLEGLACMRRFQLRRSERTRLFWNRMHLFLWPALDLRPDEMYNIVRRLAPATAGIGLEKVLASLTVRNPATGALTPRLLDVSNPGQTGLEVRFRDPPTRPMRPASPYEQTVARLRQRGMIYPYDLIDMLAPARESLDAALPPGEFTEYDLDDAGELVPVERPPGQNRANIVVGLIKSFTDKVPEGMTRVALFGDPSSGMGALAEPECRRILGGLELAERLGVPVEWFALSAGAKISMDSGVENMDWIALVLRKLVNFTQAGGEVNIVVCGVNVGAQPYWNAEATMLMHTRGVLIMIPEGSMVLTGKRALDYSGGVSAEDNQGIGGYERIMGPNGQAQYFGQDITEACQILMAHYEHCYRMPGERFPRRAATTDPAERDICVFPHGRSNGDGFERVGDIFSDETNPGRKKPFDIRKVMMATIDQDLLPLERWYTMRDAEVAVVWDAHVGGYPVTCIGLESKPIRRLGYVPASGPEHWTAGTLFPMSSKKVARALNAASDNRPAVLLANLSGFDGSPESMRNMQLEFGAEIGRAMVNFKGPIVFVVVSRYHGGAFVVFSNRLNDNMEVAALEGTYASVIGGAPAAAVVFAREVQKRAQADPRVVELAEQLERADGAQRVRLRRQYNDVFRQVHSEKLGQVADEFDGIHSVHRALEVGSIHRIIAPSTLRPYVIDAVERGMKRALETDR